MNTHIGDAKMKQTFHQSDGLRKTFFLLLILFFIGEICFALPAQQVEQAERIILNLTENPATSQAVTWQTGPHSTNPQAQIVQATDSTVLTIHARTVYATTEIVQLDSVKRVHYHSVIFNSLDPNTLYAYRVSEGTYWSEWNQFKTATEHSDTFSFIYFGDPQNNIKSMCSRIFRAAYKKVPDAGFWLFTGDIVNIGHVDRLWAELYDALGWIPRMTPMVLLPGNHSYYTMTVDDEKIRMITPLWRPQFTLPENGPDGLEETAYFFDYQGVRFVILNGDEKLIEQAKWLDRLLAENPQRWTVVAIHQPFYSTAKDRDNSFLRELFIPYFDKYSVDLVLQGHDHTYGRTYKLRNGIRVANKKKGTVYVVSVSGTKAYSVNPHFEDLMVKMGTGRQLFQKITVGKKRLQYESYTATGELYDHFELRK